MQKKQCVAMLLAGGQGSRLGILTKQVAKPAVSFGGKYRIIDFALSNCHNSGIDTVGVLTQYKPLILNSYIGIGSAWDLDRQHGGVFVLPPFVKEQGGQWYKGTADAIYQNINFIDQFNPAYVLVLSGDHIYKMDYSLMIKFHEKKNADVTIAVIEVPWCEASRFGIMNTDGNRQITEFMEKPPEPQSNLASMGIYVFNWPLLKVKLLEDQKDDSSSHDFGKDLIPKLLKEQYRMFAYPFAGYWKDVGTVGSFWEANMDLLDEESPLNLHDPSWRIYSVNPARPPHYLAAGAKVKNSIISEGCMIFGAVENSVVFPDVYVGEGAKIRDSILMPGAQIKEQVRVEKAIIGHRTILENNIIVAAQEKNGTREIIVVAADLVVAAHSKIEANMKV